MGRVDIDKLRGRYARLSRQVLPPENADEKLISSLEAGTAKMISNLGDAKIQDKEAVAIVEESDTRMISDSEMEMISITGNNKSQVENLTQDFKANTTEMISFQEKDTPKMISNTNKPKQRRNFKKPHELQKRIGLSMKPSVYEWLQKVAKEKKLSLAQAFEAAVVEYCTTQSPLEKS